eukprot:scaffold81285_cov63-Phaeocystis_antarctica.AAC.2
MLSGGNRQAADDHQQHLSLSLGAMQSAFPPGALESSALVMNTNQCWGAQLQLNCGAGCTPDFLPGKLHFKSKFCDNCRDSILVPQDRVRALSAELAACFVNKRSEGFWNSAPKSMGGGQYRILNNTAGSIGPWIALFRDQPPNFNWHAASRLKLEPQPWPHNPHFHFDPTSSLHQAKSRPVPSSRPQA